MRIDEFEFRDRNGNEIEPTKNQLVVYIKSLHKQIKNLKNSQNQKVVEELEKIKKEINLRPVIVRNCGYGDFEEILLEDVYDVINQQIKSLKGENK